MATDATGSPTPLGIPKFNTSADAPSGLGFNAAMDAIDALIAGKIDKPSGIASGEAAIWNGSAFVRSSVTKLNATHLTGYSAYTPSWSASGTAPSLGNGTVAGRFVQVGNLVHFYMTFTAGSTSTFGTGAFRFSLPVAASTGLGANIPIGIAYGNDNSAGVNSIAMVLVENSTTLSIHGTATWPTGGDASFGQTTPWTWATGDTIRLSGTYEAA
jgi:hypothetical protein